MTKQQRTEQQEAIAQLRELVKPGDTVHTILRHVSRSGMMRVIDLVITLPGGEPRNIGWTAAKAMGDPWDDRKQGIRVGGCGMDMGFHLVYNLARTLYADSFYCTGKDDCPANDHSNERGDERKKGYDKGRKHSDGGYSLRQRWL